MNECTACHVDYYYNPDIRVLFSLLCDHRVCEPCIKRLFQRGPYKCPACDRQLRASDFAHEAREARQVDSEVKVRRQVCEAYCKTAEDFATAEEYDEYLGLREDMIYRLVNSSSQDEIQEIWRQIDQYREQNAEHISRTQRNAPRKRFQKIKSIIEKEGEFYKSVNSEWGDAASRGVVAHPLQMRHQDLFSRPPEDTKEAMQSPPPSSPTPQPMNGQACADVSRQMSGGGYSRDVCSNKARHFFFADLSVGSRHMQMSAAVA